MRRYGAWGIILLVCVIAVSPLAHAADRPNPGNQPNPPSTPASSPSWFQRMFRGEQAPPPPGPNATQGQVQPTQKEMGDKVITQERNDFLRRLQVCNELKRVALATNNDPLYRQAEELERQAEEIYQKRTSQYAAMLPPTNRDAPEAQQATPPITVLENRLGTSQGVNPLRIPPPSPSAPRYTQANPMRGTSP